MMFWYGNDMNGWGWALMALGMVAFWALVIVGTIALVRYFARHDQPVVPGSTPEQILSNRFARGDIDEPEYRWRLDALSVRSGPMATSTDS